LQNSIPIIKNDSTKGNDYLIKIAFDNKYLILSQLFKVNKNQKKKRKQVLKRSANGTFCQ